MPKIQVRESAIYQSIIRNITIEYPPEGIFKKDGFSCGEACHKVGGVRKDVIQLHILYIL